MFETSKPNAAAPDKGVAALSHQKPDSSLLNVYWEGYGLQQPASGIFVYAQSLATELVKLGVTPIVVASQRPPMKNIDFLGYKRLFLAKRVAENKIFAPLFTKQAVLNHETSRDDAILHGLSNINLPLGGSKARRRLRTVITVHDLIPLLAPGCTSRSYWAQFALLLPRVTRQADVIVCVSEWTRWSLLRRYPELESKTVVIRNGRSEQTPVVLGQSDKKSKKPVIIYVARHESYKRLELFIEILRQSKGELKGVLITNASGLALVREKAIGLDLQAFAGISDEQKQQLYQEADVYVHPSLYEGFCLPAVEAMEAGLPVVHQAGSAIDEIISPRVGFAMSETADPKSWLSAVERALSLRESSHFASDLKAHLLTLPTWKDAATSLQKLYNQLSQ